MNLCEWKMKPHARRKHYSDECCPGLGRKVHRLLFFTCLQDFFCFYFYEVIQISLKSALKESFRAHTRITCIQNIVSVISHCAGRALSENSARHDVIVYVTMF